MISALELMAKFGPTHEVKPWGECIIIQGDMFDPDWEAELADQGYNCHEGIQDDYLVTYIQLKKSVAPGKVVYVPSKPKVPAPAAAEPKPKWNGDFREKCNLPIDCVDCDITECPGRKSEQLPKIDGADVLVNLVKEVTVLREGYDSLNKAYVELWLRIEIIWKDFEKTLGSFATEMPSNEDLAAVRKDLSIHKHVVSGEAMIPLEAS